MIKTFLLSQKLKGDKTQKKSYHCKMNTLFAQLKILNNKHGKEC